MFFVYILYSPGSRKTYVGYINNPERRIHEHNHPNSGGFTSRYRPWVMIYKEEFPDKKSAMKREKYFKTGKGREEKQTILNKYLGL